MTDFKETLHEGYGIGGHLSVVLFNFLQSELHNAGSEKL
jgi:hypothetical protein